MLDICYYSAASKPGTIDNATYTMFFNVSRRTYTASGKALCDWFADFILSSVQYPFLRSISLSVSTPPTTITLLHHGNQHSTFPTSYLGLQTMVMCLHKRVLRYERREWQRLRDRRALRQKSANTAAETHSLALPSRT